MRAEVKFEMALAFIGVAIVGAAFTAYEWGWIG